MIRIRQTLATQRNCYTAAMGSPFATFLLQPSVVSSADQTNRRRYQQRKRQNNSKRPTAFALKFDAKVHAPQTRSHTHCEHTSPTESRQSRRNSDKLMTSSTAWRLRASGTFGTCLWKHNTRNNARSIIQQIRTSARKIFLQPSQRKICSIFERYACFHMHFCGASLVCAAKTRDQTHRLDDDDDDDARVDAMQQMLRRDAIRLHANPAIVRKRLSAQFVVHIDIDHRPELMRFAHESTIVRVSSPNPRQQLRLLASS